LNLLLQSSGHSLVINLMNEGKVTIERRGHVLLIGLDRVPKRNAFDVAMYHDLATAYGTLDRDQDLRCGVLFAHGDHASRRRCTLTRQARLVRSLAPHIEPLLNVVAAGGLNRAGCWYPHACT